MLATVLVYLKSGSLLEPRVTTSKLTRHSERWEEKGTLPWHGRLFLRLISYFITHQHERWVVM